MASNTTRLKLLKKNPIADGADTFNIETMLNENWEKIDEKVAMVDVNGKVVNKDGSVAGGVTAEEFTAHKAEDATLTTKGHVRTGTLLATLDTTWVGSAAPFTKTQTVTGILATDNPTVDITMSGTYATDELRVKAWGLVYRITTANNSITLYATDKPTVSLPIQLKVVG